MYDFVIELDEVDQWFAYPSSNLGRVWFDRHCAEWDLSDQGIELSTTHTAFSSFVKTVKGEGMRVLVNV